MPFSLQPWLRVLSSRIPVTMLIVSSNYRRQIVAFLAGMSQNHPTSVPLTPAFTAHDSEAPLPLAGVSIAGTKLSVKVV